jgi:exonuclease SbcC
MGVFFITMAKTVFHIADIHIHERNSAHIKHAWDILLSAITNEPNYQTDVVLVIAGDIFDHKTYLTASDVSMFYDMIADLEKKKIQTLMIPGNHDYNINTSTSDKIMALLDDRKYNSVVYQPTSGIVEMAGLLFFVHSPLDGGTHKPSSEHKGKTTIAIAHEPFSESRTCSGITFGTQRFSASMFSPLFDMTMLGDIHLPQLLAPNVAYAGSFVQKNKGEGLEHGYMKWDVKTKAPTFVKINQLSLHLKIWARENTMDELPDVTARSISFYYANCDDAKVKQFCTQIKKKYGKEPSSAFNKTVIDPTEIKVQSTQELSTVVKQKLVECKTSEDQVARVLALHNESFNETEHTAIADWRIRFLSWSNVYCYGPDNYINFDAIGNLTSMVGPNKVGKSSVIDIIMLILFNETSRGSKRNALNVNSSNGHIKCVISVGSDQYAIERCWIDKKTVVVRMYKNGINVTKSDMAKTYESLARIIGSKRVFVNSTAALQHRQFIVDLSPKDIYELVCKMMELDRLRVMEDNNAAEIRALRKQKKYVQDEIKKASGFTLDTIVQTKLKLDETKQLMDENTAEIAGIYDRRAKVAVDIDHNAPHTNVVGRQMKELEHCKNWNKQERLDELIAEEKKQSIVVQSMEHTLMRLNQEYSGTKDKITTPGAKTELAQIRLKLRAVESINAAEVIDSASKLSISLLGLKNKRLALQRDIDEFDATIKQHKHQLVPVAAKSCDELKKQIAAMKPKLVTEDMGLGDIEKKISGHKEQLWKIQRPSCARAPLFDANKYSGIDVAAKLLLLRNTISECTEAIMQIHVEIKHVSNELHSRQLLLSKQQAHTLIAKKMSWNSTCVQCKKNQVVACSEEGDLQRRVEESSLKLTKLENKRRQVDEQLKANKLELAEYEQAKDQLAHINIEKCDAQIKALESRCVFIKKRISESDRAAKQIQQCEDDIKTIASNEKLQAKINAAMDSKSKIVANIDLLDVEIANLQEQLDKTEEPMQLIKDTKDLRVQRDTLAQDEVLLDKMDTLASEISVATRDLVEPKQKLCDMRDEISSLTAHKIGHEKYKALAHQFGLSEAHESAADELSELDERLADLGNKNTELSGRFAQLSMQIGQHESRMKMMADKQLAFDSTKEMLDDRELYNNIINHKSGVPQSMMETMCQNIQNRCNDVLKQIADFEIEVTYKKEINIFTRVGGVCISAEQSSGYQKFIIDLIMRQVLCSLTMAAHPRILFVDEGFGSLDKENFDIVCKTVVPALANHFEKVIIISHIQGIHDHTTSNFVINKVNGRSHLQFGELAFDGLIINARADYDEQRKQAKEQRALVGKRKKAAEEQQLEEARLKQERYGSGIVEIIDDKLAHCIACKKEFRNRKGFADSHVRTKAHLKNMVNYE